MNRTDRLMPNRTPRYVRCYDNDGETIDRYTVVFTGRYRQKTGGEFWDLGMSGAPFHPQGVGMHGSNPTQIDTPTYSHLGKKIKFAQLPDDCRKLVIQTYTNLWDLN